MPITHLRGSKTLNQLSRYGGNSLITGPWLQCNAPAPRAFAFTLAKGVRSNLSQERGSGIDFMVFPELRAEVRDPGSLRPIHSLLEPLQRQREQVLELKPPKLRAAFLKSHEPPETFAFLELFLG